MCMEDIRIGRKTECKERTVSLTTSQAEFVPHNPLRVHLVIAEPVTNVVILHYGNPGSAAQGMRLSPGLMPHHFDIQEEGALVAGPIFANSLVAGQDLTFWETLLDKE